MDTTLQASTEKLFESVSGNLRRRVMMYISLIVGVESIPTPESTFGGT